MRWYIKMILLNLAIIAGAILFYSEGFLGLRPWDASILKAGFSILCGLGLGTALVGGNYKLIKSAGQTPPVPLLESPEQAENVIKKYFHSDYVGNLARTAIAQQRRLHTSADRAKQAVDEKLQAGSMSAERYNAVIDAAMTTAGENLRSIAKRLSMFDDAEYKRLRSNGDVNIPEDIRAKQLELYNRNLDFIRQSIALNEKMILQMDTLTMEISDSFSRHEDDADALLDEISKLTDELRYYK